MSENPGEIGDFLIGQNPPPSVCGTLLQDDVVVVVPLQKPACAANKHEHLTKVHECEVPTKKRKTRRGKAKRRYPYIKNFRKSAKVIKPKAPYNSNQFLLEDHGDIEELGENLKNADQFSTTSAGRTRDSSFSVDTESEFYSSPDDEEQFLIKDFDDQYESVQAERLQSMSKDELIQEYLMLEGRVEALTKRLRTRKGAEEQQEEEEDTPAVELQKEVERLTFEVETLKRENALLKSQSGATDDDSEDSEIDSDDYCSSISSSSSRDSCSPKPSDSPTVPADYSQTNGHAANVETA